MAYPAELIRRAQDMRRMRRPTEARVEAVRADAQQPEYERAPWRSRHANYEQLMRSHDRLHPRHLDG